MHVVAQQPAAGLLMDQGLEVSTLELETPDDASHQAARALLAAAGAKITSIRPDVIVTGLSGPGLGIDEALVARAGPIPTVSLQDIPGYLVTGFGQPAQTYLVETEDAVASTQAKAAVTAIAIGALKYARYADLDMGAVRQENRPERGVGTLYSFYGQPAWQWDGYLRSLNRYAEVLGDMAPGAEVIYRPHPKETAAQQAQTMDVFRRAGVRPVRDDMSSVEQSLAVPDVVVTCFSTCGIDLVHLQARSSTPLGVGVFLMFEDDLRQTHAADTGHPLPWPAQQGLCHAVENPADLADVLRQAADSACRQDMWLRACERVPGPGQACERALAAISAIAGRGQASPGLSGAGA